MMSLPGRLHNALLHSAVIPAGCRVLVAVSGGADSVALLLLLHHLADDLDLQLEAAHLDHALRHSSAEDARFVECLCEELGVPLTLERRDVAAIARRQKGNLEEVARDARRAFLVATARERNCPLIALGHHADDQAETFLMRLLRGSGSAGLAGMRVLDGQMVRPLLPFHRRELVDFLRERGACWREDESNLDPSFTRNRIRHQLVPLLEDFNPNISAQLAGLCVQLRQDEEFWAALVARELEACGHWQDDAYVLDRSRFLELPPALAGRLVRGALRQVRGDLRGLSATHVAAILRLIHEGPPQGELDLPRAWFARRYDRLLVAGRRPAEKAAFSMELPGTGVYRLPDGRSLCLSLAENAQGETGEAVEFAAAAAPFPLQLRSRLPGDRFTPSGMSGSRKLQDLFVDLKLTREERRDALLLLSGGEIIWVAGLRRAEGLRPEPGETVLRIVVEA